MAKIHKIGRTKGDTRHLAKIAGIKTGSMSRRLRDYYKGNITAKQVLHKGSLSTLESGSKEYQALTEEKRIHNLSAIAGPSPFDSFHDEDTGINMSTLRMPCVGF